MALVKKLKNIVNEGATLYSKLIIAFGRKLYSREYKKLPKTFGEKNWVERWKTLQSNPSINCYRKYARIVNRPMDIIPMDLMNTVIQPILNPNLMRPYYLDKNNFDKIYGKENMPVTVARRINGEYFDSNYKSLGTNNDDLYIPQSVMALIAKPSRDSYGGRNILLFNRLKDGNFHWNEQPDEILTTELLNRLLGEDWILQCKLEQHPFMSQFNESSVNTFRVHVYNSPITGQTNIAGMCMRIGAKGNWFDNIHSGGFCVSVDLETGKLGCLASDGKGNATEATNGIDLHSSEFYVPDFDRLKEFAVKIGKKVTQHHSLATDIMMDSEGNFKLIEVNIGTFDANMYMATGYTPFGKFTQEVLDYCRDKKDEVRFVYIIPW